MSHGFRGQRADANVHAEAGSGVCRLNTRVSGADHDHVEPH